MYVTKPLAILALASTGFSYMIKIYEDPGCKGAMKEVNVWDNTCATPNGAAGQAGNGYRSFEVTAYGANRQRAGFFGTATGCNALAGTWSDYWADGGDDTFKKDRCLDIGFTAWSFGSRSS